jgi:hypothetical protein
MLPPAGAGAAAQIARLSVTLVLYMPRSFAAASGAGTPARAGTCMRFVSGNGSEAAPSPVDQRFIH